jgi:hypothetical protein
VRACGENGRSGANAVSTAPPVWGKCQGSALTPAKQRSYSCTLKSNLKLPFNLGHWRARKLLAGIPALDGDAQRPSGILYIGPGLFGTDARRSEHPLKCSTSRSGGEINFSHFGHFTVVAGRALSSRCIAPSIIPAVKSREDHAGRVCNPDTRLARASTRTDLEFGTQTPLCRVLPCRTILTLPDRPRNFYKKSWTGNPGILKATCVGPLPLSRGFAQLLQALRRVFRNESPGASKASSQRESRGPASGSRRNSCLCSARDHAWSRQL